MITHQKDPIDKMVLSISKEVQLFSGEIPQAGDIMILMKRYD
jgi:hypothetical protein